MASFSLRAETLALYLDQRMPALVDGPFREELRKLFKTTGFQLELRFLNEPRTAESFDRLIVVRLRGGCAADLEEMGPAQGPLAVTRLEEGRILPYAELHCDRTLGLIGRYIMSECPFRRARLFGRALARVLAHEAYHFLAQEKRHASEGVAKAMFDQYDLLSEQFLFDEPSLAKIRVTPARPEEEETEEAAGR